MIVASSCQLVILSCQLVISSCQLALSSSQLVFSSRQLVVSSCRVFNSSSRLVNLSSRRVVFSTRHLFGSALSSRRVNSSPRHFNLSSRRVNSSAAILNTEKTLGKKQTAQVQVPTRDSAAILQDGRAKCSEKHSQERAFTYRINSSSEFRARILLNQIKNTNCHLRTIQMLVC